MTYNCTQYDEDNVFGQITDECRQSIYDYKLGFESKIDMIWTFPILAATFYMITFVLYLPIFIRILSVMRLNLEADGSKESKEEFR